MGVAEGRSACTWAAGAGAASAVDRAGHSRTASSAAPRAIEPSASTAQLSPAAAPSHPASGYVSSQQPCERENCAANAAVRSPGATERRTSRPAGVSTAEDAAPNAAQSTSSAGSRQLPP